MSACFLGLLTRYRGVQMILKTDQELNSLILHEIKHVLDTYRYVQANKDMSWDADDLARWHKGIYRMQWDLRNDPRFLLEPGRDYTRHVYGQCRMYGGGC